MPEYAEVYTMGLSVAKFLRVPFLSHDQHFPESLPCNRLVDVSEIGVSKCIHPECRKVLDQRLCSVRQEGKLLIFEWSSQNNWFVHFSMTGGFETEESKYSRVMFEFSNHGQFKRLFFRDLRKWGRIGVNPETRLNNIGVSIWKDEFATNLQSLSQRFSKRTLRDFLLDQFVAPGVGNYIVNEVLYSLGEHPHTRVSKLKWTEEYCRQVQSEILKMFKLGIEHGGAGFRDYRNPDGEASLQNYFKVYGRDTTPEGNPLEFVRDGDSRHWFDPTVQAIKL